MNGSAPSSLPGSAFDRMEPFAGHARYQRIKNALTLIGCSRSTLYKLIREGDIRAIKLRGSTLIDLASVSELFRRCPDVTPRKLVDDRTLTAEQLGFPAACEVTRPPELGEPLDFPVSAAHLADLNPTVDGNE
ncbi:helix-turn-helix domain-containing protein [Bradyrhizobium sp. SEMIA]|uniref:helix-turn-helix domain-containing protein n=1 Tax=Bradyrhizobium sp. SEMIA TaxID=2597515 RepID=UPI0018A33DF4|nr:helix-turn-helix domain-containing protein [Bradyrhizobium sp. SEMIA]QOG17529.1 helix-turn-helix domain-containing protein [Bradyrhizobium sp. SEMIA]